MIVVANKRKKIETLQKEYPGCVIIDVTSNSDDPEFVKFSPFYPHGGIPVPGMTISAACVEGIWQGLKIFEGEGISLETLRNRTMKNIKRTTRTHGRCIGHKVGGRVIGYLTARHEIYLPSYLWVLQNKLQRHVEMISDIARRSTVVLLDYETNPDVNDPSKPLSHASLIKAYIEGNYPLTEGVSAPGQETAGEDADGLKAGQRVRHPKFGDGTVKELLDGGLVIVVFDELGEKKLSLKLARLESI